MTEILPIEEVRAVAEEAAANPGFSYNHVLIASLCATIEHGANDIRERVKALRDEAKKEKEAAWKGNRLWDHARLRARAEALEEVLGLLPVREL